MVVVRLCYWEAFGIRLGLSVRHKSAFSIFYGGICIEKREIHSGPTSGAGTLTVTIVCRI